MIRVHQENNLLHRFLQMQRPENLQGMKYVMGGKYIMNRPYTRAHIRLNSQNEVIDFIAIWQQAKPYIDQQRWQEVNDRLTTQLVDAREWQRVCMDYYKSFSK